MRNIYILGAQGSIGRQTLDVIRTYKDSFKVIGLSLGKHKADHKEIIETFHPKIVVLREKADIETYQKGYPHIQFLYGDDGLIELVKHDENGIVVNALMGSAGLKPTIEAIKTGKDIALANKETLVMAGDIIKSLVKTYQVRLLPIDSEHNAILQALLGEDYTDIKSITITASGGAFRDLSRDDLKKVSLKDALKHPNWSMGKKITIDSATMMNKGLEVIEAHHLFDLPYDKITTLLHKESIIHGLVTFKDESTKAIMGYPDMRMPILYALTYPKHYEINLKPLDLTSLRTLSFEKMDFDRFPLLALAYRVGLLGGLYPVVMNAANEKAVQLFIEEKITFLDIETLVIRAVESFKDQIKSPSIEEILACNQKIYESVGI